MAEPDQEIENICDTDGVVESGVVISRNHQAVDNVPLRLEDGRDVFRIGAELLLPGEVCEVQQEVADAGQAAAGAGRIHHDWRTTVAAHWAARSA